MLYGPATSIIVKQLTKKGADGFVLLSENFIWEYQETENKSQWKAPSNCQIGIIRNEIHHPIRDFHTKFVEESFGFKMRRNL